MKKSKLLTILTITAIWASGCSKDVGSGPQATGNGSVGFYCTISPAVDIAETSKADTRTLPAEYIPGTENLRLEISSGIGTVASYDVMSDYDQPLLQAGDYQADFSYGNPDTEGENAGCFKGTKQFTVVARKTTTEQVSLSLFAELFRMVQAILYRLRPDRPHRIGLPVGLFRIDRKTAYRHAPRFRESGHQTLPERFGDENQRRESRIPRNGNRHDRGPDMAYDPARRRGGGTGEHHRFARRLPDRNQRGGRGTEPRRLTENETIKN